MIDARRLSEFAAHLDTQKRQLGRVIKNRGNPGMSEKSDITRLLDRMRDGDSAASEAIIPLLYEELRAIAARCLKAEELFERTLEIEPESRLAAGDPRPMPPRLDSSCSEPMRSRQVIGFSARTTPARCVCATDRHPAI